MRIISGTFKGKKILEPINIKTRPLKDLAKESVFNIINHSNKFQISLNNSFILDLFSGVGSFGLECLSRGAKYVVFFENYKGVLPILKKNLSNIKPLQNFEVIEKNIYDHLLTVNKDHKFNIIFLDPPYKDKNLEIILNNIKDGNILDSNGIIIMHRHKNEIEKFPAAYQIVEEKNYGLAKIVFLTILN
tara:strand:- start:140 stop:706 length:567 start_codon:yes stop_codon:yes gene_type:complete